MTDPPRPTQVEFRWKEEVIFWDGDRGFVFDAAWGCDPLQTFVPDNGTWNRAVPDWLHNRRDEVVDLLRSKQGHVVIEEHASHWGEPSQRVITRQ